MDFFSNLLPYPAKQIVQNIFQTEISLFKNIDEDSLTKELTNKTKLTTENLIIDANVFNENFMINNNLELTEATINKFYFEFPKNYLASKTVVEIKGLYVSLKVNHEKIFSEMSSKSDKKVNEMIVNLITKSANVLGNNLDVRLLDITIVIEDSITCKSIKFHFDEFDINRDNKDDTKKIFLHNKSIRVKGLKFFIQDEKGKVEGNFNESIIDLKSRENDNFDRLKMSFFQNDKSMELNVDLDLEYFKINLSSRQLDTILHFINTIKIRNSSKVSNESSLKEIIQIKNFSFLGIKIPTIKLNISVSETEMCFYSHLNQKNSMKLAISSFQFKANLNTLYIDYPNKIEYFLRKYCESSVQLAKMILSINTENESLNLLSLSDYKSCISKESSLISLNTSLKEISLDYNSSNIKVIFSLFVSLIKFYEEKEFLLKNFKLFNSNININNNAQKDEELENLKIQELCDEFETFSRIEIEKIVITCSTNTNCKEYFNFCDSIIEIINGKENRSNYKNSCFRNKSLVFNIENLLFVRNYSKENNLSLEKIKEDEYLTYAYLQMSLKKFEILYDNNMFIELINKDSNFFNFLNVVKSYKNYKGKLRQNITDLLSEQPNSLIQNKQRIINKSLSYIIDNSFLDINRNCNTIDLNDNFESFDLEIPDLKILIKTDLNAHNQKHDNIEITDANDKSFRINFSKMIEFQQTFIEDFLKEIKYLQSLYILLVNNIAVNCFEKLNLNIRKTNEFRNIDFLDEKLYRDKEIAKSLKEIADNNINENLNKDFKEIIVNKTSNNQERKCNSIKLNITTINIKKLQIRLEDDVITVLSNNENNCTNFSFNATNICWGFISSKSDSDIFDTNNNLVIDNLTKSFKNKSFNKCDYIDINQLSLTKKGSILNFFQIENISLDLVNNNKIHRIIHKPNVKSFYSGNNDLIIDAIVISKNESKYKLKLNENSLNFKDMCNEYFFKIRTKENIIDEFNYSAFDSYSTICYLGISEIAFKTFDMNMLLEIKNNLMSNINVISKNESILGDIVTLNSTLKLKFFVHKINFDLNPKSNKISEEYKNIRSILCINNVLIESSIKTNYNALKYILCINVKYDNLEVWLVKNIHNCDLYNFKEQDLVKIGFLRLLIIQDSLVKISNEYSNISFELNLANIYLSSTKETYEVLLNHANDVISDFIVKSVQNDEDKNQNVKLKNETKFYDFIVEKISTFEELSYLSKRKIKKNDEIDLNRKILYLKNASKSSLNNYFEGVNIETSNTFSVSSNLNITSNNSNILRTRSKESIKIHRNDTNDKIDHINLNISEKLNFDDVNTNKNKLKIVETKIKERLLKINILTRIENIELELFKGLDFDFNDDMSLNQDKNNNINKNNRENEDEETSILKRYSVRLRKNGRDKKNSIQIKLIGLDTQSSLELINLKPNNNESNLNNRNEKKIEVLQNKMVLSNINIRDNIQNSSVRTIFSKTSFSNCTNPLFEFQMTKYNDKKRTIMNHLENNKFKDITVEEIEWSSIEQYIVYIKFSDMTSYIHYNFLLFLIEFFSINVNFDNMDTSNEDNKQLVKNDEKKECGKSSSLFIFKKILIEPFNLNFNFITGNASLKSIYKFDLESLNIANVNDLIFSFDEIVLKYNVINEVLEILKIYYLNVINEQGLNNGLKSLQLIRPFRNVFQSALKLFKMPFDYLFTSNTDLNNTKLSKSTSKLNASLINQNEQMGFFENFAECTRNVYVNAVSELLLALDSIGSNGKMCTPSFSSDINDDESIKIGVLKRCTHIFDNKKKERDEYFLK
jgi:hypothetical protein